jgi:hypothetical protein
VQEDNHLVSLYIPEPQLIGEAIAAYALDNKFRQDTPGLASIAFRAIKTIVATNRIFFKITLTSELSTAI